MSLDWPQLQLIPWLGDAITSLGFPAMTPVQASTIPLFQGNKDVIVEAVTGSGKTLAFAIPVIDKLARQEQKEPLFALVVSPTRELALQIERVFESLLKFNPNEDIKTQCLIGGAQSLQQDFDLFKKRKPGIVIATPGRLLEFLQLNVSVKPLEMLVLDEADKLLDLNFSREMNKILPMLPKQKRIGLFSATILNATENFYKTSMRNPTKIIVSSKNHKPKSLMLHHHILKPEEKLTHLLNLLDSTHFRKSIVYFPTCVSVEHFHGLLSHLAAKLNLDLAFFSLHGKLKTPARVKTLERFTTHSTSKAVLLTTDVASRGIDVEDVDLVVQLDPPTDPDVFLHRCGRTGRANNSGTAIVFLNEGREESYVDFLAVKKTEVTELSWDQKLVVDNINKLIKEWVLEDRARHDKAVLSYVSFIRYYSKHTATSIFRLQTLDYVGVAALYGVLRLPKMPEIKIHYKDMPEGGVFTDVDFTNYKYLNPKKENERLEELANEEKKIAEVKLRKEKRKENSAWSNRGSKGERADKFLKREIKKRKAELALKDDDGEDDGVQIDDWKELVKKSKKEKKSHNEGIAQFDDL